jgi:hypothetical protein
MAQTLQHPLPSRAFPPNSNDETVIVSAGTPIVLSVWRGDAGAPTVVFLPGRMSHPLLDRIVAPAKELLAFDVDRHLLFNEYVELVTGPLVDRIRRLVAAPTTAEKGGRDEPANH